MNYQIEQEVELGEKVYVAVLNVNVTHYNKTPGSYRYDAASDVDYYGETELEWEVSSVDLCELESDEWETVIDKEIINGIVSASIEDEITNQILEQIEDFRTEPDYDYF